MSARERKALDWAAKNMRDGQYADLCPYVRSNVAVWGLPDCPTACTCREVPRSYAPFLTAQAIETRRAEPGTAVHESVDTKERWQPIPGFEGHYDVSDMGRVRSHSRLSQGRDLRQHITAGYHRVSLCAWDLGRQKKAHLVHRLVLTAFVGPCPEGMEALHINGNSSDNRLCNLRWGTRAENVADQVAHGARRKAMAARREMSDV